MFIDITGQKFDRLTVISRAQNSASGKTHWNCKCTCGNTSIVSKSNLSQGKQKSCGCLKNELAKKRFLKHGHNPGTGQSLTYNSWCHMKQRCKPGNTTDPSYAEKGRKVCNGLQSFKNFLKHIGKRPSRNHSIDRIDNNGHYSCGHCNECRRNNWPSNCRWADKITQMNNHPKNHLISYNGETLTMSQWAKKLDVNYNTLRSRIYQMKWSIEKAFKTPFK